MIFLILGVGEIICAVITFIFAIIFQSPVFFISLIPMIINCILFFVLYDMSCGIKELSAQIDSYRKALNECREKLNLPIIQEEKKDFDEASAQMSKEEIDNLPAFDPNFNPYEDGEGVDISEDDQSEENDGQ